MQSINALSITSDALDWLANTRHPRILHVFDQVCNLINERKDILSIATPQIGNGPFNLIVEDEILFSEHLNAESSVSIFGNRLTLGDLTINKVNAKTWNPRPDWERLHALRDHIVNKLEQLPIIAKHPLGTNYLKPGGFDMPLDDPSGLLNHRGLSITQSPISNSLISTIASADLPSSLIAAKKLAGLGIGLTPAGDDFIMGAIYAAWIIHPPEVARVLAEEIANTAAPLTTSLSAVWLRSAGKGEAGISWHEFFDALISVDAVRIQKTMERILAVGETSGADAMAGFISLFSYWGEHCSNLWEYNQT